MKKELKNQNEAVVASNGGLLAVEQFLQNHYLFRRNVLSGKMEFATLPAGDEPEYRDGTVGGFSLKRFRKNPLSD